MNEVKLQLNESGKGSFSVSEENKVLGKMVVSVSGNYMTVYHTEVSPEAEGKGIGKKMFETMVSYVRSNHLRVIPLCVFVLAQFKRHPELYADIWEKAEGE